MEKLVEKRKIMFGPHLMLDLYKCDRQKLVDVSLAHHVLDELPNILGMNKIMPPYVVPYGGSKNPDSFDKGGISGIVIIAESHISLHSFVEQEYISIDIFSCKQFDSEVATRYLVEAFGAKKIEKTLLMRGKEFPKHMDGALKAMVRQRTDVHRKHE
ncbi:S-adenosylmethionine decarboxylase proenzyme [Candidatus Burarchaeum australiense]|nr:S-adenosylmethionine decarboxylase proenzyme [Candidatus Burarchaeum australiense]